MLALQYRWDFLIDGAISPLYAVTAVVPLVVIFRQREQIAGWNFGEALLVTGWFILLDAIIDGAISPSLTAVIDHIRKGTLDFVLLKPADAQFLVSTAKFQVWKVFNVLAAIGIFIFAFGRIGRPPDPVGTAAALLLLVLATLVLYSVWILTVSAAFYVVRVDNLTYLFGSILDAARWPISVFRGVVRFLFTFI